MNALSSTLNWPGHVKPRVLGPRLSVTYSCGNSLVSCKLLQKAKGNSEVTGRTTA